MYVQLIDDSEGNTLVSASSLSKELLEELKNSKGKISKSKMVGILVAKKALEKNIRKLFLTGMDTDIMAELRQLLMVLVREV